MTAAELPSWPTWPLTYGPVVLREFSDRDVTMLMELSNDPYVPLIGSLPADASQQEAHEYIDRQRGRLELIAVCRPSPPGLATIGLGGRIDSWMGSFD
jgi:hypothetical protein